MRNFFYFLFTTLTLLFSRLNAQDQWTASDTTGFGNKGNSDAHSLITFKSRIFCIGVGSSNGVYSSVSGNPGTWQCSSGSWGSNFEVSNLALTPDSGGILYAGGYDYNSYLSKVYASNDGSNWHLVFSQPNGSIKNIIAYKGNSSVDSLFIVYNDQVWKGPITGVDSANTSNTWRVLTSLSAAIGINQYTNIYSACVHNNKLYYGMDNGYTGTSAQMMQTNDGIHFVIDTLFRTAPGFNMQDSKLSSLVSHNGYLYAGFYNYSNGAQVLRTLNDTLWSVLATFPGYSDIPGMYSDNGTLYTALQNSSSYSQGRIMKSANGTTFSNSDTTLFGVYGNSGEKGCFTKLNNHLYYACKNSAGMGNRLNGTAPTVNTMMGYTSGQVWRTCLTGSTIPVVTLADHDSTVCSGTNVTATVTSTNTSYLWSNGSTSPGGPLQSPGLYYLTVTDANGCYNATAFHIGAIPVPLAPSITSSQTPCKGIAVTLSASDPLYDHNALEADGSLGYAASHDLTSHLNQSDSLTLELWFKAYGEGVILMETDTSTYYWTNSQIEVTPGDTLRVAVSGLTPISLGKIDLNTWHHVALRYDKANLRLDAFLNGVASTNPSFGDRQSPFEQGYTVKYLLARYCYPNLGSGNYFNGQLRDFRVWKTCRTNAEIVSGMNSVVAVSQDLVATYPMNQGSGTVLTDASGNNLNGTIYNGATLIVPPTFNWSPATFLNTTSGNSVICTADSSVTYTITSANQSACTSTATFPVFINKLLFLPSNPHICKPDSAVTISAAFLSQPNNWSDFIVNPNSTSWYRFDVNDGSCAIKDSILVQVGQGITMTLNPAGPVTLCYTDTALLGATITGGTTPITYHWMDGTNTFTSPTIYVSPTTPTTYTLSLLDAIGCSAASAVSVTVNPSTLLTGTITLQAGGTVQHGAVYLFKHQPGSANADSIGFVPVSTTGAYTFANLNFGDYLIKAIADTNNYPNAIATYFGNEYIWDSSTVYTHGCAQNDTANIQVITVNPMTGTASISGYVIEGVGYGARLMGGGGTYPVFVPGGPIRGVDVKLGKNPGGGAAARIRTDSSGYYHFHHIDVGNYTIYVDIPNLPMDSTRIVNITGADSSVHNDYLVDSTKIYVVDTVTLSIHSTKIDNDAGFKIYPNPAKGMASIVYELKQDDIVCIEMYNALGEEVTRIYKGKQQKGNYSYTLDARHLGLKNGVYILNLRMKNSVFTQRIVIIE